MVPSQVLHLTLISSLQSYDSHLITYQFPHLQSLLLISDRAIVFIPHRYADDTTLLAESTEELLQLVTSVKEKSAQAGLYLNLKKTKVMSTVEIEEFEVDGEKVGVVRDFVFLGAKIEDSGSCKGKILRRQDMERQRYGNYNKRKNNKCISFPSSAVWLWILDDKKSREKKNWQLWVVVLEKTATNTMDCKTN